MSGNCIDKTIYHPHIVNQIINLKGDIKMTEIDQATLAKAVELFKQWMFTDEGNITTLLPAEEFVEDMDNRYGLKNTEIDRYVRWQDQRFGLNCGYTDEEVRRWIVGRCDPSTEPIKYGETIAIGLGKQPTWLNHAHRTFGVNLEFQSKPSCQWIILGGPIGTPVHMNDRVALFNTEFKASADVRGEPLIYHERHDGGFKSGTPTTPGILESLRKYFRNAEEAVKAVEAAWALYQAI
jgi:hypothetical protein